MKMKLTYLYPDLCGLYGDRGNAMAFKRIGEQLGINVEIERVDHIGDKIDYENTDIMLLSPGELSTFPNIIEALKKDSEALNAYLEAGKYFFVIGSSASVFADEVHRSSRPSYQGLGIGHFDCEERDAIYGDDLIYTCHIAGQSFEVSGCQIQTVDIIAKDESEPFGQIIYGYGNHHTQQEGIRYKNLIITNTLGPMFVKNPWILSEVMADIAAKKEEQLDLSLLDFTLEKKSFEAFKDFNSHKKSEL